MADGWVVLSLDGVTRCATPAGVAAALRDLHTTDPWRVVATAHPAGVPGWLSSQPGVLTLDDPVLPEVER